MRRNRMVAIVACAGALAGAPGADAGECLVNGNPVPPSTLAAGLEGSVSLPGQLAGVPFSVVSYDNLAVFWTGCAADCVVSSDPGDTQCGNLVADPIDSFAEVEVFAPGDPPAFSQVLATQSANGRWQAFANSFVNPSWEETGGSAAFSFGLGTREFIDVTSGSGAETLPLDVQLRVGSHMGIHVCRENLFHWIPQHTLLFRVTENSNVFPFTRTLVNELHSQFFGLYEVFPVEVRPNSTLTVDVLMRANANATGGNDIFGGQCAGGLAFLDLGVLTATDGIQVGFVPDPALTLTPRSGITYEPVPEPAGAAAALGTLLLLGALRRGGR